VVTAEVSIAAAAMVAIDATTIATIMVMQFITMTKTIERAFEMESNGV
jgi:hypothetical protein